MKIYIDRIPDEGILIESEENPKIMDIGETEERFLENIVVSFRVYKVSGNLIVVGSISTPVSLVCSCCLQPFTYPIENKRFAYDCEILGRDTIDLTEPIREDIIIALPQRPVCRQDCRGLCMHCGQNLNERECGCSREVKPPNPFGVLDKLI